MQEVDFASLTAREAAPDPTDSECGADMQLYMHDCRRLIDLGLKRWGGDAPGRLGPRVLDPKVPYDLATIKRMFNHQPPLQPIAHTEATDDEAAGEEPTPQLQQQTPALLPARPAPPPAPQPPLPQPPAPQPLEAPPGPAPTEAPPLLVPPSALHGLGLDGLVSQLEGVLAAATLDEAMVGHVLDGLEGLGLSGQEMSNAGAPPTAHVPGMPRTYTAHPRAPCHPAAALPPTLTLSRPRAGACKLVNRLRKKPGVSAPLKARANELYEQWTRDGDA